MAEKRGKTAKLVYDFPTEALLEIQINDNWYRTTPNEFRSFDGSRRYSKPYSQPKLGDSTTKLQMQTVQYLGPLYAYGTNKQIPKNNTQKINSNANWEQRQLNTQKHNKFKI